VSRDVVWRLITDVENWPTWSASFEAVLPVSGGGLRPGAHYLVKQPRSADLVYVVTCKDNFRFTWESRAFGCRLIADHELEAAGEGCQVTHSFYVHGRLSWLITVCFGKKIHRLVSAEAVSLKIAAEHKTT
jgi:hypothetical protein